MSATRREDNNRIEEKDDQEMEATVFNSQETTSGLFTLGELETEESSGKVASWEISHGTIATYERSGWKY